MTIYVIGYGYSSSHYSSSNMAISTIKCPNSLMDEANGYGPLDRKRSQCRFKSCLGLQK